MQHQNQHCLMLRLGAMQGVVLRRTKQSTIDGQPIINLPPRQEKLVKARECPLNRRPVCSCNMHCALSTV
jgi:hypothetical protein